MGRCEKCWMEYGDIWTTAICTLYSIFVCKSKWYVAKCAILSYMNSYFYFFCIANAMHLFAFALHSLNFLMNRIAFSSSIDQIDKIKKKRTKCRRIHHLKCEPTIDRIDFKWKRSAEPVIMTSTVKHRTMTHSMMKKSHCEIIVVLQGKIHHAGHPVTIDDRKQMYLW